MIDSLKILDAWNIQLRIEINFVFSKNTGKGHLMHSKSDNIQIMICGRVNEVIQEVFESLLFRYQTDLHKLMNGRKFIFDCANLLHYKCHEINLKYGELYIDSPNRIKSNNKPYQ